MGPIPWTRLEGTDLWAEAQAAYALPPGRTYHGFGHVLRLYEHAAQTFHLPYDPALDLAVLAHDALIEGSEAEARSITWLLTRQKLVREAWSRIATSNERFHDVLDRAGRYILATERHRPTLSTASMVLLDLADFLDAEVSRVNTAMLREEKLSRAGTRPLGRSKPDRIWPGSPRPWRSAPAHRRRALLRQTCRRRFRNRSVLSVRALIAWRTRCAQHHRSAERADVSPTTLLTLTAVIPHGAPQVSCKRVTGGQAGSPDGVGNLVIAQHAFLTRHNRLVLSPAVSARRLHR